MHSLRLQFRAVKALRVQHVSSGCLPSSGGYVGARVHAAGAEAKQLPAAARNTFCSRLQHLQLSDA